MTCYGKVNCYDYISDSLKQFGKSDNSIQRYRCVNAACKTKIFMLEYRYRVYEYSVKQHAIDMVINSSGICDTAIVLKNSKGAVISRGISITRDFSHGLLNLPHCVSHY